jgi:hypothetical protein
LTKTIPTALIAFLCLLCFSGTLLGQAGDFTYRSPEEIIQAVKAIAGQNSDLCAIHKLGSTPGNRDFQILQLGTNEALPGILVVANMEGNAPLAGEAALKLANLLLGEWQAELNRHTWYILPVGNPDAYASFFRKPLVEDFRNAAVSNDDKDEASDEDGPEDLNGDGYITTMRQRHPEGGWVEVAANPLLLREAKASKGEHGVFRLYTEGTDNDGDGEINEDGPGGTNPGRNFPHNFEHFTPDGGSWGASEEETRALLRFAFDRPNIGMILVFGRCNSLREVPSGSQRAADAGGKHNVPKRWAERMGVDPEQEFTLKELTEMAREFTGYSDLTEDQVAQWMGLGAAAKPNKNDVTYWEEISKQYADFIKEIEFDAERLDPPGFANGSVDEWAYYQYGVPTFSMDFWTLPKPKEEEKKEEDSALSLDDLENTTEDEFIELGEEKIAEFLEANDAPKMYTAEMVIKALKGGMMTTKKIAEFMKKGRKKDDDAEGGDETEKALFAFDSSAIIPWQEYDHPTLGKVEIGGPKPWATLAPPVAQAGELLDKQLPFVKELAGFLPELAIAKTEVEKRNDEIWKLDVWVKNNGRLPYPTHQGKRCQRPSPASLTLSGGSLVFLEGKERKVLGLLEGSGGVEKVSWLVQASEGSQVTIDLHSFSAGKDSRSITLKGGTR